MYTDIISVRHTNGEVDIGAVFFGRGSSSTVLLTRTYFDQYWQMFYKEDDRIRQYDGQPNYVMLSRGKSDSMAAVHQKNFKISRELAAAARGKIYIIYDSKTAWYDGPRILALETNLKRAIDIARDAAAVDEPEFKEDSRKVFRKGTITVELLPKWGKVAHNTYPGEGSVTVFMNLYQVPPWFEKAISNGSLILS